MFFIFKNKAYWLCFLYFLCLSACSPACRQWNVRCAQGDCPPISYVKATLADEDAFNGLQAELLVSGGEPHLYLNVLILQLPCADEGEDYADVIVETVDQMTHFLAIRFEGGQRVLLPDEALQVILPQLLENCPVDITIGRFHTTLIPDNFTKVYETVLDWQ